MEIFGPNPGRKIIAYFAAAILIGGLILALPICGNGKSIGLLNAFFTSTSAICVTGLTAVSTADDLSLFGQIVVLILIQIGGLGIMTLATGLFWSLGSQIPLNDRLGLGQSFGGGRLMLKSLLKAVVSITITIELVSALMMFTQFAGDLPLDMAIYASIFHAVSAFCNAGFSIFPDSLESYRGNIVLIAIFAVTIVAGGMGFALMREVIAKLIKYHRRPLTLHTKLCLLGTGILLVAGTLIFFIIEGNGAFANMETSEKIANAFFQSITPRTAGFNTVPQPNFTESSLLFTIVLMFIGVCPGSTGGGIKITSMAVILLLIYSRLRGKSSVNAFHRSFNTESIVKAVSLFVLAVFVIGAATMLLIIIESSSVSHSESAGWMMECLFEVVSAFGTVGLSLGITPELSAASKIIIMLCMFAGRVGLLTIAYGIARRPFRGEVAYSDEPVMIG